MTSTKYDELCSAVLEGKTARAELKKLFTEKFSEYMGCQEHDITININESAASLNPITYDALLSLKVDTDLGDRVVQLKDIIFKHHPEKAPNYQFQALYKGVLVNLCQHAEPMFDAIFTELQREII